ncbi:DAO-domain-containing protein [Xylariaceae sp. FL0255]|nr:DAO-domain-containing protein [Xylariaceae sp. FL0255]
MAGDTTTDKAAPERLDVRPASENDKVEGAADEYKPPKSILIIGSGVFGLSTARALTQRPEIPSSVSITIIDRSPEAGVFPAPDASSIDSSRIIRADYADYAYAALAAEAQIHWREGQKTVNGKGIEKESQDEDENSSKNFLGGEGRYTESGLFLGAQGTETVRPDGKPTGLGYVKRSWVNSLALAAAAGRPMSSVRMVPFTGGVAKLSRLGGEWADWGYLNEAAGWADAEASMKWYYESVKETGRVEFVNGTVEELVVEGKTDEKQDEKENQRVTGAKLTDGRTFSAELVIVAAGAWTPSLLDMTGQAIATGQVLGYFKLTEEEEAKLSAVPVCLNLTDGCFIIPPRDGILKIARHSYGYLNPQPTKAQPLGAPTDPQNQDSTTPKTIVSQPLTHLSSTTLSIPAEGATALRSALKSMLPWSDLSTRPFHKTRLCWYTDTVTGDWIIDYHPSFSGLFVATGGSGHAFKFLPVLGDKVVDCLVGRCPPQFKEKWKWKGPVASSVKQSGQQEEGGAEGDDQKQAVAAALAVEEYITTEDGSRGGKAGLILKDEMVKSGIA